MSAAGCIFSALTAVALVIAWRWEWIDAIISSTPYAAMGKQRSYPRIRSWSVAQSGILAFHAAHLAGKETYTLLRRSQRPTPIAPTPATKAPPIRSRMMPMTAMSRVVVLPLSPSAAP
jgi:hypothetical protein